MEIISFQKMDRKNILDLYKTVTEHLRSHQIDQWNLFYPNELVIRRDLMNGSLYGIIEDNLVIGAIVQDEIQNKRYKNIKWKDQLGKPGCIHRLAVRTHFQGRGIGQSLLEFAEQQAILKGYSSIRLDVYSVNTGAVEMYRKNGYSPKGNINFPLRKFPFYCMEKQLKAQ